MESPVDQWVVDAITRHGPALERSIRALVRNDEEAADICQEVALRLLIATRTGSPPDVPAAWMQRVGRNLVINAARRRATAKRTEDRLIERTVVPGIDRDVLELEQQAALRSALEAARDIERDVILLAAGGLPTRAIADHLGRSELATRALLCRARAKVRRRMVLAGVL